MVDDFTRECLTLVADTSLAGLRVARELDAIIAVRGQPVACPSNGSELTGTAIQRRCKIGASSGTTSHQASRNRTPSQNPSSDGRATSA